MQKRQDGIVKIMPGERFTPFGLAKKLSARAMLESSSYQRGRERYSVLMVDEAFRVEQRGSKVLFRCGDQVSRIRSSARDILGVLRYFADQHTPLHQDFPYPAGGVGYLSYEFARMCDSVQFRKKRDPLDLPDASFLFGHVFVIFDHYTDLLYLIGLNYAEHEVDLPSAVAKVEARINDLNFTYLQQDERSYTAEVVNPGADREDYLAGVRQVRQEIIRGNLLQGVLSRRVQVKTDMDALEAYRRLRTTNPSPYLFYIDFNEYQLFGSSPEMHVKVKEDEVTIRPIAGTRRRGEDQAQDEALAQELLGDEKERAEHLMLIDLARNDIGRVCEPGSVEVVENMAIERFSRVMHIVSKVKGRLLPGKTGVEAIRATFPAGTVSGAPKISAMQIIDGIEPIQRKFYAGLVGYMEPEGNLDTCITIRSALCRDGNFYLQAGAGVVFDSTPEREYQETEEKLSALMRALGLEVQS
ncbi:anthranilate synthase component I [Spirochaeta africana]|uniref:Anthranilate synthase component 1 n=1 Tax=Spirochaeta africana (strain ATCC 700263 / DSM 8902 / Z-7692) TaxID=889378 RepID=H9UM38_SPIAZ|nr:anthranilate synthase component I [Spirochaeta africana]AFG38581.1 anthranilate synthase component I [Spirochaeta africana DSM 8902]